MSELIHPVSLTSLENLDAFFRIRTSEPTTLFESRTLYDIDPLQWDTLTANGGAAAKDSNAPQANLSVTTASGSRVVRQTYQYIPYQPGKSRLMMMTGVLNTTPQANCRARIGCFDNHADKSVDTGGDGFFFELDGTTVYVVRRSYVTGTQVDTRIPQSEWNLNQMSESGLVGRDIFNPSQAQIFTFEQEWLGTGTVLMGFVIGRRLYWVHRWDHANLIQTAYTRRASLPLRYEIENTGATGAGSQMRQICSTVMSEGGFNPIGGSFSVNRGTTVIAVTTEAPIIAIRAKAANTRAFIKLSDISAMSTTANANLLISIYGGPGLALTGGAWVSANADSFVEYNVTATAFTGGVRRYAQYMSNQNREVAFTAIGQPILALSNIAGTQNPIIMTATSVLASADTLGALTWQEY
jgi:hypothetical protein